jgi:ABC-2 type transport system ATP-binding protein
VITLEGLTKRYGDTTAVDGLDVEIAAGRVTGFLGPNGAGKSTTMRMILGLDRPTAGRATVDGRAYRDLPAPLHHVGALLEADALHPGRSARNHLRALARSNGIPDARVDAVLDQVGLAGVARRRVKGFSLGMRQRLGIAAALLGDPAVLLFDEPVNGLDPDGVRWVRHLLRDLAAEGRTVLVSSHLMSEMQQTADHLLVIGRGRLLADAPIDDVMGAGRGRAVRVRTTEVTRLADALAPVTPEVTPVGDGELLVEGATAEQVGRAAFAAGVPVLLLQELDRSLEQAYMELTATSVEYAADGRGGSLPGPEQEGVR